MTIYSLDVLFSQFGTSLFSMSRSNCCFLACIQVSQEAGQVVWYSHLFQNFPQFIVIHTVKGFGVVNKAEIDVFLELSCFFHDPVDVGNSISSPSDSSKTSLNIWKFMVHVLLKPGLENFEHYFTSMWNIFRHCQMLASGIAVTVKNLPWLKIIALMWDSSLGPLAWLLPCGSSCLLSSFCSSMDS